MSPRTTLSTDGGPFGAIRERVVPVLRRRIAIDARALAAFRIALGSLLLADLLRRSRNLVAFYTDDGVLPRSALFADYGSVYSIHATWGEPWIQWTLFAIAGLLAVALLVGYHTRIATVGSWALLLSLHVRNPMVLNGGDILFRMLLFWAIFLPLGERWSVDAGRRDRAPRDSIASAATVAVLLQVVIVYVANANFKLDGEKWLAGEAISYALSLGQFTVLLGDYVADWHLLLTVLTYLWLAMLVASPLLILLTGWPRAVFALLFAGMHLGMLVTMRLDLFPLIVVAGLLLFFPPRVWDGLERRLERRGTPSGVDRAADRLTPSQPGWWPTPSRPEAPWLRGARSVTSTAVVVVFLSLVLLTNAASADLTEVGEPADTVLDVTGTHQHWQLFAPDPKGTDAWFVADGRLDNGSRADVLHGGAVSFDRPPDVSDTYPSARWRKYLVNVWGAGNTNHRSYLANYLCDRWNRRHATAVRTVTLTVVAQPSRPFAPTEPAERHQLIVYDCEGPLVQ